MANRTSGICLALLALALGAQANESERCVEDASLLQSKRGPHLEAATGEGLKNPNPWAKRTMKKYNHHRHAHNKVVDSSDYRADAAEFYENIKDKSLAERCPMLKIMTLQEVEAKFNKAVAQLRKEVVAKKHFTEALQDLKRDFSQKLDHGKPVIVEASVPKQLGWRAETHWGQDELAKFMGNTSWSRSTFNYPDWIISLDSQTTLADYLKNKESAKNVFLFASESGCEEMPELKELVDVLRGQFAPAPQFGYGPETCTGIIAIDGIGSSHGFHSHDPVWNTQVSGTKHWWLLEPYYGASMVDEDGLMDWGGAPKLPNVADVQAFEFPNACALLKEVRAPPGTIQCVTKPGEMLILPDSWMHATCGLTEFTIAAGGWLGGVDIDSKEDEDVDETKI